MSQEKSDNDNQSNKSNPGHESQENTKTSSEEQTVNSLTLQEQLEKSKSDFLYLRAEFENYKKNVQKERLDLIKYSGERLAYDIISVIDNFDRALSLDLTAENMKSFHQGIVMTSKELKSALQKHGIQEVESSGPFDPNIHEALSSEFSNQVPQGHILRVFQKAYKMHDKLMRPAKVIVAKSDDSTKDSN